MVEVVLELERLVVEVEETLLLLEISEVFLYSSILFPAPQYWY
jgi:hypothetical protein